MNQRKIILQNLVIFLSLLLPSCSSKDSRNNKNSFYGNIYKTPYVISVNDSLIERHYDSLSRSTNIPPPPHVTKSIGGFGMYYGHFNIIFYPNNRIFFHNKDNFHSCGTGLRDDETDFLDIQPDDIIEVSPKSAIDIIQKNKRYSQDLIALASLSDTIQNPFFDELIDFMNKNRLFRHGVRRATEEERNVLDSKLNHKFYDKEDYKWVVKYRNNKRFYR